MIVFLLSHVIPGRIETSPRTSKNFFVWSSYRTFCFANYVFFYGLTYGNSSTLVVKHSNGKSGRVIALAVMIIQPHSYQKKIKKTHGERPKEGSVISDISEIEKKTKSFKILNHIVKHGWHKPPHPTKIYGLNSPPGLQVCVDLRPAKEGEDREDCQTVNLVGLRGFQGFRWFKVDLDVMGCTDLCSISYGIASNHSYGQYEWRFEVLVTTDWPVSFAREPPWFSGCSPKDTAFWNKSKHWLRTWVKKDLLKFCCNLWWLH